MPTVTAPRFDTVPVKDERGTIFRPEMRENKNGVWVRFPYLSDANKRIGQLELALTAEREETKRLRDLWETRNWIEKDLQTFAKEPA